MKIFKIQFYRLFLSMAMMIGMLPVTGQVQCHDGFKAFIPGEKLNYRVSYNWGVLWIDAADVEFKLSKATFGNQQAFHIISTGTSFKRWDWLFKVRDTFEVYVEQQSLKPLWHKRHTSEGGYVINNLYHFDYPNNTITAEIEESRKPFHTKLIPMQNCTYDVLGASYVVRSLDYSQMEKGERFIVNMVVDDQVFALPVIYQGIETIRNRDRQQYECIAIDAILDEGTMFKPGEALRIWLSNDDNRIPVMMEAKVRVGSVKVYLTDFDTLKAPLTSLR